MNTKRIGLGFYALVCAASSALAACGSNVTDGPSSGSGGCDTGGTHGPAQPLALDTSDYDGPRVPIRAFYDADVLTYWAAWGLPPLARRSHVMQESGGDFRAPFAGLSSSFNAAAFTSGVEGGTLPASFAGPAATQLETGAAPWDACVFALRAMVDASDQAVFTEGAGAAIVAQTAADLHAVFAVVFDATSIAAYAPTGAKDLGGVAPPNFPNEVCSASAYDAPVAAGDGGAEGGVDDHNTQKALAWTAIANANYWNVTYSAACIAVAVGACASEADPQIFDSPNADCELYNSLSQKLGAKPGALGGYYENRDAWFAAHGYCGARAWTGPFETACAEAFSAFQRGCDLFIDYDNPDPTKSGHTEHVENIHWDGPGSGDACDLDTRSWGHQAGVHYGGGQFSGKSDGTSTYGGGWLAGKAAAHLSYFCKCRR